MITAERVQVDGRVEGPITGRDVVLKSGAYVMGDICHQTLIIESGAHFDGSSRKTSSCFAESDKSLEARPAPSWNEVTAPATQTV